MDIGMNYGNCHRNCRCSP